MNGPSLRRNYRGATEELAPEEENSSNTRLEPNNAETGKAWGYIENLIVPTKDKDDENW